MFHLVAIPAADCIEKLLAHVAIILLQKGCHAKFLKLE